MGISDRHLFGNWLILNDKLDYQLVIAVHEKWDLRKSDLVLKEKRIPMMGDNIGLDM